MLREQVNEWQRLDEGTPGKQQAWHQPCEVISALVVLYIHDHHHSFAGWNVHVWPNTAIDWSLMVGQGAGATSECWREW